MVKLIKFALSIGNVQIYTLEELRENFFIDDILVLYRQGKLQRWLKCRGYYKQLEQLKGLYNQADKELITTFAEIFEVDFDSSDLETFCQSLNFVSSTQESKDKYLKLEHIVNSVAKTHYQQYQALIEDIKCNHQSLSKICNILQSISEKYLDLMTLDLMGFVYAVKDSAPLALIGLLMNNKIRALYDTPFGKFSRAVHRYRGFKPEDPLQIINQVVLSHPRDFQHCFFEFHQKTENDDWSYIEGKNVKCMVILCTGKCLIQAADPFREDILDAPAVNGRYPILNGLMFKGYKDALVRYVIF